MTRYLIILSFIAIVPFIKSAEVQQELRRIIDESITPGELHEDQLEERIKSWAGIRTMDGARALYDIFENARLTKNGDDILACSLIQKKLEVSPDQVASFLLARTQENMEEVPVLEQDIRFLGLYTDDPRVPNFLVSLLNDKRRLYDKHGKELIGSIPRVCDAAKGELTAWLEKKEMIKFGEPGWTDAVSDAVRDKDIADIKPLLVKAGAIEGAGAQRKNKRGGAPNPPDPSSNVRQAKQSPVAQPKSVVSATTDGSSSRSWLVWLLGGLAAIACVLWFFLRKSPK